MKGGFRGRQSEDEPSVTCIHRWETENIPEECPVGLGILAVNDYVGTRDHRSPPGKSIPAGGPSIGGLGRGWPPKPRCIMRSGRSLPGDPSVLFSLRTE